MRLDVGRPFAAEAGLAWTTPGLPAPPIVRRHIGPAQNLSREIAPHRLAAEAGITRTGLYTTYAHLKDEFEARRERLRDPGAVVDPARRSSPGSRTRWRRAARTDRRARRAHRGAHRATHHGHLAAGRPARRDPPAAPTARPLRQPPRTTHRASRRAAMSRPAHRGQRLMCRNPLRIT